MLVGTLNIKAVGYLMVTQARKRT